MMESEPLLHGGQIVALVAIVGTIGTFLLIMLTAIVVPMWRKVRLAEAELKLKSELVAAGYSAEEVVRIVEASTGSSCSVGRSSGGERYPARPVAMPASDAFRGRN